MVETRSWPWGDPDTGLKVFLLGGGLPGCGQRLQSEKDLQVNISCHHLSAAWACPLGRLRVIKGKWTLKKIELARTSERTIFGTQESSWTLAASSREFEKEAEKFQWLSMFPAEANILHPQHLDRQPWGHWPVFMVWLSGSGLDYRTLSFKFEILYFDCCLMLLITKGGTESDHSFKLPWPEAAFLPQGI